LISEHGDLVCLEIVPELSRGHDYRISNFL
jgi:hypothetical protein